MLARKSNLSIFKLGEAKEIKHEFNYILEPHQTICDVRLESYGHKYRLFIACKLSSSKEIVIFDYDDRKKLKKYLKIAYKKNLDTLPRVRIGKGMKKVVLVNDDESYLLANKNLDECVPAAQNRFLHNNKMKKMR